MPAKDIAKRTKTLLYDGELYRIKDPQGVARGDRRAGVSGTNDKSHDELFGADAPLPTFEEALRHCRSPGARAAVNALLPLWRDLPRGPDLALQFADRFPTYSAAEQDSFLAIGGELSRIVREVSRRGGMDREAEIQLRLAEEGQLGGTGGPVVLSASQKQYAQIATPDRP